MVTIEQKLTLFSKLLNQEIKEENDKKMTELDKEYEKILAENKYRIDRECNEIIEAATRKAETKKVELISKGKLSSKKENMLAKEKIIDRFMNLLEEKIKAFVTTEEYHAYLAEVISGLSSLKGYSNPLVVYLTKEDYDQNQGFIKSELVKVGIDGDKLSFSVSSEEILGGLIINDPELNTRVDESIRAAIEDEKDSIVERITLTIEQGGDEVE